MLKKVFRSFLRRSLCIFALISRQVFWKKLILFPISTFFNHCRQNLKTKFTKATSFVLGFLKKVKVVEPYVYFIKQCSIPKICKPEHTTVPVIHFVRYRIVIARNLVRNLAISNSPI